MHEADTFRLIDCPGLGDLNMPLIEWAAKLNESNYTGSGIALALMVIRQKVRPEAQDKTNFLVMKEALDGLQPKNIGVIFTFIEENAEDWNMDFATEWLEEMFSHVEMPCPARSNIFLFKGKDKNGVTATPSEELAAWVRSTIPPEAEQAKICESFDYAGHVKSANESGDAGVIALLREELAMLRKMIENQGAAMEKIRSRGGGNNQMMQMMTMMMAAQNKQPMIVQMPSAPEKQGCSIF